MAVRAIVSHDSSDDDEGIHECVQLETFHSRKVPCLGSDASSWADSAEAGQRGPRDVFGLH